jgi:hypothetical protein
MHLNTAQAAQILNGCVIGYWGQWQLFLACFRSAKADWNLSACMDECQDLVGVLSAVQTETMVKLLDKFGAVLGNFALNGLGKRPWVILRATPIGFAFHCFSVLRGQGKP